MKKSIALTISLIFILTSLSGAVDWKGRLGVGLRGPLYSPMIKGGDFSGVYTCEPFMMGLGGNVEIKYGLSRSLVLGLTGGFWYTYDDTVYSDDQSFKLNKSDNASTRLKVIPISLTGHYYFIPEGNIQPYLLGGLSMDLSKYEDLTSGGEKYSSTDLNVKCGAGINFWIGETMTFELGGRFSYLLTNLSNDFPEDGSGLPVALANVKMDDAATRPFLAVLEPGIGLTFFIGGARDTDKDGVKDNFDQCADTPIGALVDTFGCPLDTDGDGIYDGLDKCPDTPKGAFVDISGCPIDTDKDGVPDGIDLCKDTPTMAPLIDAEGNPVDKDSNGIPDTMTVTVDIYGCPVDDDKDGIPDFKDRQLDTPIGAVVDSFGVALDTDGDNVPDGIDKCPDTGEGVVVDEFGCPMAKPITEKITLNIKYAPGSAEPDEEAKVILNDLVERLKVYGELKIEINGYTDALGSSRSNLKLSQKRAEAVKEYLVAKGIAADRLIAKGYGEDPKFFVDTNETPEGRAKNRRVEVVPVK
jgi:outer membrane protein OmpA-like peptidoglycan-associated protein